MTCLSICLNGIKFYQQSTNKAQVELFGNNFVNNNHNFFANGKGKTFSSTFSFIFLHIYLHYYYCHHYICLHGFGMAC